MDTTNQNQLTSGASIQRAASRASARSGRSGVSRASSASRMSRHNELVKKNIELHDLKPADVLIERFVAWKAIVKQLGAYFEGIADIENNTARELHKLAGVIQVPFRAGNQFLGEGGLQDTYLALRNKTRLIADQHADLGRTIDSSIVQHLDKLRVEVKAHIKNVQNDTAKLASSVAREREVSTRLVGELANAISTFKNTPMGVRAKGDPYIANQAVSRQLQRQVLEENLLQKSIVMMQQNSAHFEEGIVKAIQSAWATYDEWKSRMTTNTSSIHSTIGTQLRTLAPDQEWIQFAARSPHLLHPDTPLRDPSLITYPLKDDPSVVPVHTGHLERKSRWTRAWTEGYFVLTPAGFLHGYADSDERKGGGGGGAAPSPTFSLFLPQCTLGPYAGPRAAQYKFSIEGRKDGTGTTPAKSGGTLKSLFAPSSGGGGASSEGGAAAKSWSFRARSREEMMEWWNDMRMLCARYLIASESVDRTGPVEEAVRSVGYLSGDEEEEELTDEEEVDNEYLEGEDDVGEDAYVEGLPGHHGGHHAVGHHQHDAHAARIAPEGLGAPVTDRSQAPAQARPLNLGTTATGPGTGATQDYGYEGHHVHNLPGHLHDEDGDGSSVELEVAGTSDDHSHQVHHPGHLGAHDDEHDHEHDVQPPVYQHTGPQTDTAATTAPSALVSSGSHGSQGHGGGGLFGYAKSLISGEKQGAAGAGVGPYTSATTASPKTGLTAQGFPDEKAVYKAQGYDVGTATAGGEVDGAGGAPPITSLARSASAPKAKKGSWWSSMKSNSPAVSPTASATTKPRPVISAPLAGSLTTTSHNPAVRAGQETAPVPSAAAATSTEGMDSAKSSGATTPRPLPLPLPLPQQLGARPMSEASAVGLERPSSLKRVLSDPSSRRASGSYSPSSKSPSPGHGSSQSYSYSPKSGGAYPFGPFLARAPLAPQRTLSTPLIPSALGTHAYAVPSVTVSDEHAQGETKNGAVQALETPRGLDRLAGKDKSTLSKKGSKKGDGEKDVALLKPPAFSGKPQMTRTETRRSEHVKIETVEEWTEKTGFRLQDGEGVPSAGDEGKAELGDLDADTKKHIAQQPKVEDVTEEDDEDISNAIREWDITLNDKSATATTAPLAIADEKDAVAESAEKETAVPAVEADELAKKAEKPPAKADSNKSKKKKKKGGRK